MRSEKKPKRRPGRIKTTPDPFPKFNKIRIKHNVRKLHENASEDEIEANKEISVETFVVLKKGYPNLPADENLMIGKKRGNGKTFIGTKGRIRTRRNMKRTKRKRTS